MFLKLLILSLIILLIAVMGLGIRMLLVRNGKFSGGSCSSSPGLQSRGIDCGCGGSCTQDPS